MLSPLLLISICLTAILYSSVGHGGASGYLAIMSLFALDPNFMRPTALMLNLLVAGISFWQFYRRGFFKWTLFWPFVVGSIPAAFFGGLLHIPSLYYKIILGVLLLFAVIRMLIPYKKDIQTLPFNKVLAILLGAIIGFLSGLIGIGGGIVLSPVLLLLGWANLKQTAAVSALFIWVNSLAGLLGFFSMGGTVELNILLLLVLAGIGAIVGGYLGSFKWKLKILKTTLAIVLFAASIKLMFL